MLLQENKWSHENLSKGMHQMVNHDPTSSKAMSSWERERREHGFHKLASCIMLGDPWEEKKERLWNTQVGKLCYARWPMGIWVFMGQQVVLCCVIHVEKETSKLCYVSSTHWKCRTRRVKWSRKLCYASQPTLKNLKKGNLKGLVSCVTLVNSPCCICHHLV